ncbi:MAG: SDR family NAD(P)-dependent oxidoreductase [Alphaproteobacteria bacterium]|nr:SDR family NAD(P)-dependent oxidoreductase [Alphaproteobacteria bacterium]
MSASMSFAGKTAVITGAASGIGRALAEALAERGCNLALADVNEAGLADVAQALASNEIRVTTHRVDVGDKAAITDFADAVRRDHGAAHLLFNNAGVALGGQFEDIAEDDFEWLIDINFWGPIRMTRAFLPLMRESGEGHITNISSIFGVIAPAGQTAYSAAKFGVRGFSDALRHEMADSDISVTTVHPGGVNTSIAKSARMPASASQEEIDRGLKQAADNLVMPPPKAADIILRGVERRRPRVLVGRDAHLLHWIERLWPSNYWGIMKKRLSSAADAEQA